MNEWLKEWAQQEVCKEMNPFGVVCTSVRSETHIQDRWGKLQKNQSQDSWLHDSCQKHFKCEL